MLSAPPTSPESLRARIEGVSRPVLVRLHGLPRLLVPLGTVLLIVLGAFAPLPYGLLALGLLFVFLVWIAYLSWPAVPAAGRLLRLTMLVLVVVFAVLRLGGHGAV